MIHSRQTRGLGPTIALRFGAGLFGQLSQHLGHDRWNEQFAFALCRHTETSEGTILIVHELFLPSPTDLSEQSGGGVCPAREFMRLVYKRAWDSGSTILDIHTHPHAGVPRFSGIDEHHARKNAEYITETFPPPVTQAMLVFGYDIAGHDAVVYDRDRQQFRPIDRVEVLGRPLQIRPTGEEAWSREHADPRYARQRLVPGWDQEQLSRLRVGIVGAGGTGAQLFQTFLSLGVGTKGWLALIDHDEIEVSNLPRIPYAAPRHVGRRKVDVARAYGKVKNPNVRIHAIVDQIRSPDDVPLLRGASVIFGAGDNDGVRRVLNEVSVRNLIPLIDLGCDIQIGDEVHAGGQARLVIPGENACLVCCGGYDPAEAALDLLDEAGREAMARHGYVRGADADATPSVVNLNAITAQLGVTALLALVHGEVFGNWHYARFDQLRGEVISASSSRSGQCPVCGPDGVLALAGAEPTVPAIDALASDTAEESREHSEAKDTADPLATHEKDRATGVGATAVESSTEHMEAENSQADSEGPRPPITSDEALAIEQPAQIPESLWDAKSTDASGDVEVPPVEDPDDRNLDREPESESAADGSQPEPSSSADAGTNPEPASKPEPFTTVAGETNQ